MIVLKSSQMVFNINNVLSGLHWPRVVDVERLIAAVHVAIDHIIKPHADRIGRAGIKPIMSCRL